MKRILFVADASIIHTAKYVDYFVRGNKYEVMLATYSQDNVTECDKICWLSERKISKAGMNFHYILGIYKLVKIIREFKPDYINAHFSYSMGFIAMVALFFSGINSKVSVVCHGSDILAFPAKICKYINYYVLNRADRIIAVSPQVARQLDAWHISKTKIFVGQYGVDIKELLPVERDVDILSIRDYVPNSRIDDMLLAISDVENIASKKIVFVLPYCTDKRMDELKIAYPYINFYPELEHSKIIELMNRSRIYISATKSDGAALSLLEAMAYGAYPIVSNIEANQPWIGSNKNGRLFDDMNSFKQVVAEMLKKDDDEFAECRKINHMKVKENCSYNLQMEKIERFLIHG